MNSFNGSKDTNGRLKVFAVGLMAAICAFVVLDLVWAWSNPIAAPPGGNAPAPINVSSTTQTKTGGLNIAGSLGIGTTTPSYPLHLVYKGASNNVFVIDTSSSSLDAQTAFVIKLPGTGAQKGFGLFKGTETLAFAQFENNIGGTNKPGFALGTGTSARDTNIYRNSADVLRTDDSFIVGGNVGIGTTTPGGKLTIEYSGRAAGNQQGILISNTSVNADRVLEITANTGIGSGSYWIYAADTAGGKPFVVRGDGNVGIGTTTPAYQLHLSLDSAAKPNSNTWTIVSDQRLKKNIKTIGNALDKMLGLHGVTFEWKEPEKQGNLTGTQMGLIAQEVEKVFPQWVKINSAGYKDLTVSGFEGLTAEAIRELKAENNALKARIEALEAKLNARQ